MQALSARFHDQPDGQPHCGVPFFIGLTTLPGYNLVQLRLASLRCARTLLPLFLACARQFCASLSRPSIGAGNISAVCTDAAASLTASRMASIPRLGPAGASGALASAALRALKFARRDCIAVAVAVMTL